MILQILGGGKSKGFKSSKKKKKCFNCGIKGGTGKGRNTKRPKRRRRFETGGSVLGFDFKKFGFHKK